VTGQRITSDSSIKPRLRNTIRPGSMKIGLDCWMSVTGVELRRSKESWRKICVNGLKVIRMAHCPSSGNQRLVPSANCAGSRNCFLSRPRLPAMTMATGSSDERPGKGGDDRS
jgi:hypothetical protein